ncbi:uncharacterized protein LOC113504147 [Trichoplusia ni]|uniref:Uncharacterized protein LOC113504147 n=1 Tax=Trichoplusia ni TaxID=7111 RepID=A0A7E5WPN4_TRINI|nr:uncharacterized protein LOC113504147 [Trichoplusia ni]
MLGPEKKFSPTDLLEYADMLLKAANLREAHIQQQASSYSWLSSRHLQNEHMRSSRELETLRPMVQKMSPESCAKIAVKLDNLTDGEESTTAILDLLKNLIDEQHNIQMMDQNVKKGYRKNRVNKVHPELVPYGRQPTVSFILYSM